MHKPRLILTLAVAFAVTLITAPSAAFSDDLCVVDSIPHPAVDTVTHPESRYKQETPAVVETTKTEYRFQSRTWIERVKEVKSVEGYNFVEGGRTTVDGTVIGGHWQKEAGFHAIPDVIINIVWGPDGVPSQYLGEGQVNLSVYGGPNATVPYVAYALDFSGWSDWGPWSDWSTEASSPSDTQNVETRTTGNGDGTPAVTSFYLPGGSSSDLTEANWTVDSPPAPWVLIDTRTVTDSEGSAAWVEEIQGACPPVVTPPTELTPSPAPTPLTEATPPPAVKREPAQAKQSDTLAATGGGMELAPLWIALVLVVLGGSTYAISRKGKTQA